jgi:hypothetical protein
MYLNKYLFVAFHTDAYFPLCCEVLLYFIEWVEVIEIQIWFEFKLVWNLEKIWKIKKPFSFFLSAVGRNQLIGPAWCWISPLCTAHVAAQRNSTARGPATPATAQPDPSSPRRRGRVRTRTAHGVRPLRIKPNQCGKKFDWRIKTASQSNPLRDKTETPINRRP